MKASIQKRLRQAKRRIERRLEGAREDRGRPMLGTAAVRYELAGKARGIAHGGIGLLHRLAEEIGLVAAIDRRVQVLKFHRPYHESDHVLNLAYNALCDGTRLEDIELRRNDAVFLDALDAERIPDPTTAGDFCRRFAAGDIRNRPSVAARRERSRTANGVQDVPERLRQHSLPNRPRRAEVDLPRAQLQSASAGVLPSLHGLALLKESTLKPEFGCSGPPLPPTAPQCNLVLR